MLHTVIMMSELIIAFLFILLKPAVVTSFQFVFRQQKISSYSCTTLRMGNLIDQLDLTTLLSGTVLQKKPLNLLYKATRDGWSAESFHDKSDVGQATIVIGAVGNGLTSLFSGNKNTIIVGGYNPIGWASVDDYRNSKKAFLFQYNSAKKSLQICRKLGSADCAVYDFGAFGPLFGSEALQIPLNPSKLRSVKGATSFLGNEYELLADSNSLDGKSATGITARRSGMSSKGNSLFGDKNLVDLIELETYSCDLLV